MVENEAIQNNKLSAENTTCCKCDLNTNADKIF
jgi:hypothetical protein